VEGLGFSPAINRQREAHPSAQLDPQQVSSCPDLGV